MRIQDLAIIFIIIILPISLVIATYTQYQIQTINTQTLYDTKLSAATYDAIRAIQINTADNDYSEISNSRIRDLEASVSTFKNSVMTSFALDGYSEDEINNYIPALVYTLYDGFYIYSPYTNINYRYESIKDTEGNDKKDLNGDVIYDYSKLKDDNQENIYGLKPYISYSCRYNKDDIDVVITYALDNYITVQGQIGNSYVNESGYLIDGISGNADGTGEINKISNSIYYNGVEIVEENLKEYIGNQEYQYVKLYGTKYYLVGDEIKYISNGEVKTQITSTNEDFEIYKKMIEENNLAKQYYYDAYNFTKWFKQSGLSELTYGDAYDTTINENGDTIANSKVWSGDNTKIFDFNTTTEHSENIENELSNFNQHRLAVIRHKIEVNLAIAISNYNNYSNSSNEFQMPDLAEDEWDYISHNISLISFLQGLPIGGKIYNGYSLVTNSESEEVVLESNIYILGTNSSNKKEYYRIGDIGIEDGSVTIETSEAGRVNRDFTRKTIVDSSTGARNYYYPLKDYNASYSSIIMQNNMTTYDDIYAYVNEQSNELKIAFYTALGRERASKYKMWNDYVGAHEYTVTLDPNGGTVYPTEIKAKYLSEYGTLPTPEWEGHTFEGWYTEKTGGERVYADTINNIKGDSVLYAHWTAHICKVTLKPIYDESLNDTVIEIPYGSRYVGYLPTPTRKGYKFSSWYYIENATTIPINNESICKRDVTLRAKWTAKYYIVRFDHRNGKGTYSTKTVRYGKKYGTLPTADRKGYNFLGWYTLGMGKRVTEETVHNKDGDIKLYAYWTPNALGGIGTPNENTSLMLGTNPKGNAPQFGFANIDIYTVNVENGAGKIISLDANNNTGENYTNKQTTVWKNLISGNYNGEIVGASWKDDCLSLSGNDSYVNLGQISLINKVVYTVEILVKEIQNDEVDIISNFETGGAGMYLYNGLPSFDVWSEKENGYIRLRGTTAIPTNKKVKLEGFYDGNSMYLKVDGEIVASK